MEEQVSGPARTSVMQPKQRLDGTPRMATFWRSSDDIRLRAVEGYRRPKRWTYPRARVCASGMPSNYSRTGWRFQVLQRSAVCREDAQHHRLISESTGSRHRAVHGLKESGADAEPHRTDSAAGSWRPCAAVARLRTTWSDIAVCAMDVASGSNHQHLLPAAPTPGVSAFSESDRRQSTRRVGRASGHGQLRHTQSRENSQLVGALPPAIVHFTPTSAGWLNLVERLFAEVTDRCVRRVTHTAVRTLEKAMLNYLDRRNGNPKPFIWTADADLILGKVARLSKCISRSGH
jgi:hypothetical protein